MDSFEKNGIWFLPENRDVKIPGTLTFSSNQKPRLNLVGQLGSFDIQERLEKDIEYPIIQGDLIDKAGKSEQITLCKCYQKKELKTGIQTSELYPEYIIKGYHFASLDEIKFKEVSVQYNYLEKWVNLPNIKTDCINNKKINCYQQFYEPIEVSKLNNFSITIIDQINYKSKSTEVLIKEQKKILIKSEKPEKILKFRDIIDLIQEFLTFACGQIILPCKVQPSIDQSQKKEGHFPIEIFYQVTSPLIDQSSFNAHNILFKFTDIREYSHKILNNWQKIQQELTSIIQLYLRLHYVPVRHTNDLFLTLAQAIEGFHRIYYEGKYCDDNTFNKIKEELTKTFRLELTKYDIKNLITSLYLTK